MIKFLLNGILRDKSRSLLPIIVVTIGVFLTVLLTNWMGGIKSDMIKLNANFTTGHLKVMTRAYAENIEQKPNDLAILDVAELMQDLSTTHPTIEWVSRIQFGGLLDVGDENGETKAQGPASGMAIDLLSKNSKEAERLNIKKSLVKGRLPRAAGEALLSNEFLEKLAIKIGDQITFFGSTMDGSMTFKNFEVVGTLSFGVAALDRGAIIVDLADAQMALAMEDAASEVLGYFKDGGYEEDQADKLAAAYNAKYAEDKDEFAPTMQSLADQNDLRALLLQFKATATIMIFIFVFAMSIVLWNTGLLGGLRRYGEFGVRLALGESKPHIYKTLIYEGVLVGVIGSLVGTFLGLGLSYYLQENGLDFSWAMKKSSMMIPSVYRAEISPFSLIVGFIPGVFSIVLGNALSGLGIYKRDTAQLFKELEV